MFRIEDAIGLAVLAILASYLYLKHRQRALAGSERSGSPQWIAKPIDVAKLKPSINEVRRDFLAARQRERGGHFHQASLDMARRSVVRLAFFQHRESDLHEHSHGA
jgi:hypothetical protein